MDSVIATYPDGSKREMPEAHAKILKIRGIATYEPRSTYLTRDMRAAQRVTPAVPAVTVVKTDEPVNLEAMTKEELHALAGQLGVKVHHMAGAIKVREALVASGKVKAPE